MKKELMILVILLVIVGCNPVTDVEDKETLEQQTQTEQTQQEQAKTEQTLETTLNDFQIKACTSAHEYNTCYKLADLGIVSSEKCCSELSKCC